MTCFVNPVEMGTPGSVNAPIIMLGYMLKCFRGGGLPVTSKSLLFPCFVRLERITWEKSSTLIHTTHNRENLLMYQILFMYKNTPTFFQKKKSLIFSYFPDGMYACTPPPKEHGYVDCLRVFQGKRAKNKKSNASKERHRSFISPAKKKVFHQTSHEIRSGDVARIKRDHWQFSSVSQSQYHFSYGTRKHTIYIHLKRSIFSIEYTLQLQLAFSYLVSEAYKKILTVGVTSQKLSLSLTPLLCRHIQV